MNFLLKNITSDIRYFLTDIEFVKIMLYSLAFQLEDSSTSPMFRVEFDYSGPEELTDDKEALDDFVLDIGFAGEPDYTLNVNGVIEKNVSGKYFPATLEEPAEYPTIYITGIDDITAFQKKGNDYPQISIGKEYIHIEKVLMNIVSLITKHETPRHYNTKVPSDEMEIFLKAVEKSKDVKLVNARKASNRYGL